MNSAAVRGLKLGIVAAVIVAAIFVYSPRVGAQALNVEISPVKSSLTLDPGTTSTETIRVRNNTEQEQTFFFTKEDFTIGDSEGNVTFFEPGAERDDSFSLIDWLQFDGESITVPAQDVVEFDVLIEVPFDAEPGGHYAAVFIQTASPQDVDDQSSSISTVGRIGSLLLVDVPGEQNRQLDLVDFTASQDGDSEADLVITTRATVNNSGNVHIVPSGSIRVSGAGVDQVIEFNDKKSAVLPGTPERVFTDTIEINKDGIVPLFGRYTVEIEMIYDSGESAVRTQTITIIPFREIALLLLLVAAASFIVWRVLVSFKPARSAVK